MASRQWRARVRAALSISSARSQSTIATRKRPGTFTNKRLWHAMLIAFMCFSGHANAKTWYYFRWHTPHSELPMFDSMDAFCKSYSYPEWSYFVPSYSPTGLGPRQMVVTERVRYEFY